MVALEFKIMALLFIKELDFKMVFKLFGCFKFLRSCGFKIVKTFVVSVSTAEYGDYWELLNKYNLNKMNVRQSLCSCRFCFDYIENYLNGTEGRCPDSMSDYRNQVISLTEDMQIDHVTNMKVSRITVKCPESICKFEDEFKKYG